MLPITVDLDRIRVIVTGAGEAVRRRLALLEAAGARAIEIYAPQSDAVFSAAAGSRLRRRLPRPDEIAQAQLVFISGLAPAQAANICQTARIAGVLVNVEDDRSGCDFHSPAVVRRGDLTIAIATGGKSPGLAAWLRRRIERMFGREWAGRLEEVAAFRRDWRGAGADSATVGRLTAQWAEAKMAQTHTSNWTPEVKHNGTLVNARP
jgi:precorrin-2 dehydrogenase / sirohydrochlorin ferrochelatase